MEEICGEFANPVRDKSFQDNIMKIPLTCRILYAEDNQDSSEMMKVLLGFAGIEVVAVPTIAEAWKLAQSDGFDLFLLDSRFPDGDGLKLCSQLRRFAPHTPIFFYSGLAYQTDRENGLAAGADEYLVKPAIDNLPGKILSAVKFSRKNENQSRVNVLIILKDEKLSTVAKIPSMNYEIDLIQTAEMNRY